MSCSNCGKVFVPGDKMTVRGLYILCDPCRKEKDGIRRELVRRVESRLHCNCDLDNWEPEKDTGHSWVCRIHKEVKRIELEEDRNE